MGRRLRRYREATMLIFRAERGRQIHVGFFIDGRPSPTLNDAFSRHDGVKALHIAEQVEASITRTAREIKSVLPSLVDGKESKLVATIRPKLQPFINRVGLLESKIEEVKFCVSEGADEIDMVISRGRFLQGEYNYTFDEVAAIKEACGPAHLKVILETGELHTLENVRKASDISMAAGADFIKTSTGKVTPSATQPVTLVMLEAIRDHYYATGKKIGMKPAGGIRDSKTALRYLVMVKETLGADWLNPHLFRFGASVLANDLLMQIIKLETGVYGSADFYSKD
jgi:deoxyribose-phosphate aldolase